MFLRRKHSPSGQVRQLLEACRNAQGQPRHRVVISLGGAPLAQKDWKGVAQAVGARLYGQGELSVSELSDHARQWVDSITRRVTREGRWLPLVAAVADPSSERLDGATSLTARAWWRWCRRWRRRRVIPGQIHEGAGRGMGWCKQAAGGQTGFEHLCRCANFKWNCAPDQAYGGVVLGPQVLVWGIALR